MKLKVLPPGLRKSKKKYPHSVKYEVRFGAKIRAQLLDRNNGVPNAKS